VYMFIVKRWRTALASAVAVVTFVNRSCSALPLLRYALYFWRKVREL